MKLCPLLKKPRYKYIIQILTSTTKKNDQDGFRPSKRAPTNMKKFLIQRRAQVKGQTQESTKQDIEETWHRVLKTVT